VRVDDSEDHPEEAFAVNAIGARNVAVACEKINAVNVYISTDYVFDGSKNEPYIESDLPNPVNVYGLSKYAGEIFTRNCSSRYYIVRSASLYGTKGARGKGGNFIGTMIQKAKNNEEIKVVNDIFMSPTYTKDAAEMIRKIIEKDFPYGVYHITNKGYCSWYEFAREIFKILKWDVEIKSVKSEEYKTKARRPRFSAMFSTKLEQTKHWKEALKEYLAEGGYVTL